MPCILADHSLELQSTAYLVYAQCLIAQNSENTQRKLVQAAREEMRKMRGKKETLREKKGLNPSQQGYVGRLSANANEVAEESVWNWANQSRGYDRWMHKMKPKIEDIKKRMRERWGDFEDDKREVRNSMRAGKGKQAFPFSFPISRFLA
jgi:hypothetical protein